MDRRDLLTAIGAGFFGVAGASAAGTPAVAATTGGPTVFNFGAVGDGSTDDSNAFTQALAYSASKGLMVTVPAANYAIKKTISWTSTGNVGLNWGFNCQGASLISSITGGQDIIRLQSNHIVRYFNLTGGLTIQGSGHDGNGIHLYCPGSAIYFYNNTISNVSASNCGANGLLFEGNVFESVISNSFFQKSGQSGACFAQSKSGVVSAINVLSCYLNENAQYGLCCTNFDGAYGGTTDVRVYGGYCRDNQSYGFFYNNGTAGSSCVEQVGFENNCRSLAPGNQNGAHIYALCTMTLRNVGGYNQPGGATYLLRGYFTGLTMLDGCVQAAGGAMAATGKSALVQVNGSSSGFVLMRGCSGNVVAVSGTPCGWSSQSGQGSSPRGNLNISLTI